VARLALGNRVIIAHRLARRSALAHRGSMSLGGSAASASWRGNVALVIGVAA